MILKSFFYWSTANQEQLSQSNLKDCSVAGEPVEVEFLKAKKV